MPQHGPKGDPHNLEKAREGLSRLAKLRRERRDESEAARRSGKQLTAEERRRLEK